MAQGKAGAVLALQSGKPTRPECGAGVHQELARPQAGTCQLLVGVARSDHWRVREEREHI